MALYLRHGQGAPVVARLVGCGAPVHQEQPDLQLSLRCDGQGAVAVRLWYHQRGDRLQPVAGAGPGTEHRGEWGGAGSRARAGDAPGPDDRAGRGGARLEPESDRRSLQLQRQPLAQPGLEPE